MGIKNILTRIINTEVNTFFQISNMAHYFIRIEFFSSNEKKISLLKIEEPNNKSSENMYQITEYSISGGCHYRPTIIKEFDNRKFSSYSPLKDQLKAPKGLIVEISLYIYRAMETLYNELFDSFIAIFEKNYNSDSPHIDLSSIANGDYAAVCKEDENTFFIFFTNSQGYFKTLSLNLDKYGWKSLSMNKTNDPFIPDTVKGMSCDTVSNLEELFFEKQHIIEQMLIYIFDVESDTSVDFFQQKLYEKEEREFYRDIEEFNDL